MRCPCFSQFFWRRHQNLSFLITAQKKEHGRIPTKINYFNKGMLMIASWKLTQTMTSSVKYSPWNPRFVGFFEWQDHLKTEDSSLA